MSDSNIYQYPLNMDHPYPVAASLAVQEQGNRDGAPCDSGIDELTVPLEQSGVQVKIKRGPLKGYTGLLVGCTDAGMCFVWGDCNSGRNQRLPIPHGPLARDELEVCI